MQRPANDISRFCLVIRNAVLALAGGRRKAPEDTSHAKEARERASWANT
jgi:hypothetical protein